LIKAVTEALADISVPAVGNGDLKLKQMGKKHLKAAVHVRQQDTLV
jgi:hypothetical protein